MIVFRAHSGLLGSEGEAIHRTCLFTSEPYSESKHVLEQLADRLAMARMDESYPWVFAIGDEFVARSMEGQFSNTVIIMMGCSGLYLEDMAQAFIEKGASTYIAWDVTVGLGYTDDATAALVEELCTQGLTVGAAVAGVMQGKGPDPDYGAVLKYYPPQSADRTLKQLIE